MLCFRFSSPSQAWRKLSVVGPAQATLVGPGEYPLNILNFRFSEMQFCAFLEIDLNKNEPKATVKVWCLKNYYRYWQKDCFGPKLGRANVASTGPVPPGLHPRILYRSKTVRQKGICNKKVSYLKINLTGRKGFCAQRWIATRANINWVRFSFAKTVSINDARIRLKQTTILSR